MKGIQFKKTEKAPKPPKAPKPEKAPRQAGVKKIRPAKTTAKKVKSQFVLSVGDDGAILSHFQDGKLANRIFIDSPNSDDVKLLEKLMGTYPKIPVYMLVDVVEQNYSQQVLPPVSSFGVQQQIARRLKRDFQPNDLNNVMPLGRSKEGRKDWYFLFISLANNDPFAKWLDIILAQKNKFGGVFLLPVETTRMVTELAKLGELQSTPEWEIFVLHNKTGGFRIIALKEGKLVFTRLAHNLIGDNIPDIVVGNLEQEISNTVEYLKRLAYKNEQSTKISVIAAKEVVEKIDPKALKFGDVNLYTPHQAAQKLGLPESVADTDKFADVLCSTYFAVQKKHVLKFHSKVTKKIDVFYNSKKAAVAASALLSLGLLVSSGMDGLDIIDLSDQIDTQMVQQNIAMNKLREIQRVESELPRDYAKIQEILEISKLIPRYKYHGFKVLAELPKLFGNPVDGSPTKYIIKRVEYSVKESKGMNAGGGNNSLPSLPPESKDIGLMFEMGIDLDLLVPENEVDRLETYTEKFKQEITALFPQFKVEVTEVPKTDTATKFEPVTDEMDDQVKKVQIKEFPAKVKISGFIGGDNES